MKTVFLKKVTPFAVVALGIFGAFATTSMQSTSKASPEIGYTLNAQKQCDVPVECNTIQGMVCRVNGDSGAQAFGKNDQEDCTETLYQP